MSLACRTCRRPLTSAEGCALCLPIKANLVTTDENSEEYPALSDVGSEVVGALQAILREHKRTARNPDEELEKRIFAQDAVIKVANTLAKVLEAARKLQNDGFAAVRNMSFQQRAELFAGWYQNLPPNLRAKVREGQEQFELRMNQPAALPEKSAQQESDK